MDLFPLKINCKEINAHYHVVTITVTHSSTMVVVLAFDLVGEVRANLAVVVLGYENSGKVLLVVMPNCGVSYLGYAVLVMLPLGVVEVNSVSSNV